MILSYEFIASLDEDIFGDLSLVHAGATEGVGHKLP